MLKYLSSVPARYKTKEPMELNGTGQNNSDHLPNDSLSHTDYNTGKDSLRPAL